MFCFPNVVWASVSGTFCIVSDTLVSLGISFHVLRHNFFEAYLTLRLLIVLYEVSRRAAKTK